LYLKGCFWKRSALMCHYGENCGLNKFKSEEIVGTIMLDIREIEEEMLRFWEKNKIYEKSKKKNLKGKKFYFLQGPPYTSGKLHIGHAWNNNMKDIALRFFRMNGFNVWDRAGYDMHGLPTANKVQKELGLEDKDEILKYGLDKFNTKCKEFSTNSAKMMTEDLKRFGIWMDFSDPYLPVSNEFMSAEWLLFKRAHEQKRLYKGKKIMHWCRVCETSLAKHELEYNTKTDNSIFIKFKVKEKDEFLVVWTTTPWTITYNLAVMVGPDIDYVRAEVELDSGKETWIVASKLAGVFIGGLLGLKFKVIDEFKGSDIDGLEYVHPYGKSIGGVYAELKKESNKVHTVLLSEKYVDTTAGSGLVHCAPGCGPEDYEVGQEYGINPFNTLSEKGVLEDVGDLSGLVAKRDDKKFIKKLDSLGSLIKETPVEHEYAHCWRCSNPVVFKTTEQWFLKIEDLIPQILKYNQKVKWEPDFSKKSYEAWIGNLKDNGVTRQRFWGTPMPVWECACGEVEVIGSQEELAKKATSKLPSDLHRPWIDKVKIQCVKCKKKMSRVPDVVDVWIDSGTVGWNCLYYPEKKNFFEKFFPADLILEATEQTRLWFSMLQICSSIVFGKQAYTGAYNHGMIMDFGGIKMSKSLGNIISPYEVIDKFSSDILRYYICETTAGKNINFSWDDVKQKQRNLLVLLNTSSYLLQLKDEGSVKDIGLEEKYILSRTHSTIKKVTDLFNDYKFDQTIPEIEKLFLDISRVYIKLTRDKSSYNPKLVKATLEKCYVKTLQMFSCICPLFCEKLWQTLREEGKVSEESVHLSSWPQPDKRLIDETLENDFAVVLDVIELGLAFRDKNQLGLKWPSSKVVVTSTHKLKKYSEIIMNQLNVKDIEFAVGDGLSVTLDLNLTFELKSEGFAREIARKVQSGRKKAGLVKDDRIELFIVSDIDKELLTQEKFLLDRVGATDIAFTQVKGEFLYSEEGKIKGKDFIFGFKKA